MNVDLSPEDRTILAALEALENGGEPPAPGEATETAETLTRLYTEVMGLVPYGLEPAAPRPEAKVKLLAAIRGEEAPAPLPKPAPIPRPATSREMPAATAPRVAMVPRRRSVWPMALAAMLILALSGLSGWLFLRQQRMEETIARLETELATERREAEQSVAGMQSAMERMRVNFSLVTAPAVKVSPLRPADPQNPARGILFVAADNQHWYLAVHDLPPAPQGRKYQLWWDAEEGMSRGGDFNLAAGEKMELYSDSMPAGTRDVLITLEPDSGAPRPTGPVVLRAAGVYQL